MFRFVAVFFRGECTGEDDDCDGVLAKVSVKKNYVLLFFYYGTALKTYIAQSHSVTAVPLNWATHKTHATNKRTNTTITI